MNLIFLSAGFFQSLVIIVMILRSRAKMVSGLWLIAFLVVVTIQIILKGLSKVWLLDNTPVFLSLVAYDLPLLFGPLAFFYVKSAVGDGKFRLRDMLLFIPFAIEAVVLISFLAGIFQGAEYLLPNNTPRLIIHAVVQIVLLTYCVMLGISLVNRALAEGQDDKRAHLSWLKEFLVGVLITGSAIIVALKVMYYFYPMLDEVRYVFLVLTGFVYWVTFKALTTPTILNERSLLEKVKATIQKARYFNSRLKKDQVQDIERKLSLVMKEGKLYLQPGLTIIQTSDAIGVSRHHLSQVLNTVVGKTFNEFVNGYRIERARALLSDPAFNYLTIAAIAFESGFNSVSSFNLIFKKVVGQSPAQFKRAAASRKAV